MVNGIGSAGNSNSIWEYHGKHNVAEIAPELTFKEQEIFNKIQKIVQSAYDVPVKFNQGHTGENGLTVSMIGFYGPPDKKGNRPSFLITQGMLTEMANDAAKYKEYMGIVQQEIKQRAEYEKHFGGISKPFDTDSGSQSLSAAIKAFWDEILTGLTDEERAEIEKLCKEYLDKNPLKNAEDVAAFNMFVESLLKKYGFKGDTDGLSVGLSSEIEDMINKTIENSEKDSLAKTNKQKSALSAIALMYILIDRKGNGKDTDSMRTEQTWPNADGDATMRKMVEVYEHNMDTLESKEIRRAWYA